MYSFIDEAWGGMSRQNSAGAPLPMQPLASMGFSAPVQYPRPANDAQSSVLGPPGTMLEELMTRETQNQGYQQQQQQQMQQMQQMHQQQLMQQQHQAQLPAYHQTVQASQQQGQASLDPKDVMILKLRNALVQAHQYISQRGASASCKKWEISVIVMVVLFAIVLIVLVVMCVRMGRKNHPRLLPPHLPLGGQFGGQAPTL